MCVCCSWRLLAPHGQGSEEPDDRLAVPSRRADPGPADPGGPRLLPRPVRAAGQLHPRLSAHPTGRRFRRHSRPQVGRCVTSSHYHLLPIKSAPYLRLKNSKRISKCQVFFSTVPAWGKNLGYFFRIFLETFFEVSGKSHSAEKCKNGAFGSFWTSIVLQNRKKLKCDPLETLNFLRKKVTTIVCVFLRKVPTKKQALSLTLPRKILSVRCKLQNLITVSITVQYNKFGKYW